VCFRAWLDMGFCERREGGLGSVAGCGCDYCMMVVLVERSYSVQNFCTNPAHFRWSAINKSAISQAFL